MQRRGGELNFGGSYSHISISVSYPSLRKLEGVVAKLEPLSDQNALIRFLRNVDNAKTLTGFVQELSNAITDYQVRAASPAVITNKHPIRFRYNKECTRGQGISMMTPRASATILKTSSVIQKTSSMIPRTSATVPGTSSVIPRTSSMTPRTSW